MEQYETSLEQYILGLGPITYERLENPRLFGAGSGERGIWNTWDIMEQIANGVTFIHHAKLVHGNLKTRNGNLISLAHCISAVLCEFQDVESRRSPVYGRGLKTGFIDVKDNRVGMLFCARVTNGLGI